MCGIGNVLTFQSVVSQLLSSLSTLRLSPPPGFLSAKNFKIACAYIIRRRSYTCTCSSVSSPLHSNLPSAFQHNACFILEICVSQNSGTARVYYYSVTIVASLFLHDIINSQNFEACLRAEMCISPKRPVIFDQKVFWGKAAFRASLLSCHKSKAAWLARSCAQDNESSVQN